MIAACPEDPEPLPPSSLQPTSQTTILYSKVAPASSFAATEIEASPAGSHSGKTGLGETWSQDAQPPAEMTQSKAMTPCPKEPRPPQLETSEAAELPKPCPEIPQPPPPKAEEPKSAPSKVEACLDESDNEDGQASSLPPSEIPSLADVQAPKPPGNEPSLSPGAIDRRARRVFHASRGWHLQSAAAVCRPVATQRPSSKEPRENPGFLWLRCGHALMRCADLRVCAASVCLVTHGQADFLLRGHIHSAPGRDT